MERFIIGRSEAVEAEYSYRATEPVTLLFMADDEPVGVEGFSTLDAARDVLKKDEIPASQIEYVGENLAATYYRFVRPDGKATRWARVPKHGIAGPQYARARRDLGENFRLETNDDMQ